MDLCGQGEDKLCCAHASWFQVILVRTTNHRIKEFLRIDAMMCVWHVKNGNTSGNKLVDFSFLGRWLSN
jgi:hypothetical protein